MRTFRTFALMLIAFASTGCETVKEPELRINNVVRVFMHEPHRYTLLARRPEAQELDAHTFAVSVDHKIADSSGNRLATCGVHLRADVEMGAPMWATVERWREVGTTTFDCILTIHLHDPQDVEGGGWTEQRGKKTVRGTTQVVE